MSTHTLSLPLRFAVYSVDPVERIVRTTFPNGLFALGTRDVTPQNAHEARAQGYEGDDAEIVWRSLVDHEILHSLVAECLWVSPSRVLRTEAGGEFVPTWLRYEEEAAALASQAWIINNVESGQSVLGLYANRQLDALVAAWREMEGRLWTRSYSE